MVSQMSSSQSKGPSHSFHRVDASPWPAFTSLAAFGTALGLVLFWHQKPAGFAIRVLSRMFRILCATFWWRDVFRESEIGYHNPQVQRGLELGVYWFILSEAMFFFGLIWAFCNARRMPTLAIGGVWPPTQIQPVTWYELPLVNSALLLASFFTANAAKSALDNGNRKSCANQLIVTILLGLLFLLCQYFEYGHATFNFSSTVFGCNFYLTTGFHGFHVLLGVFYRMVCLFRVNDRTLQNHLSLKLAVRYWHFVDVVWIGIFSLVYLWGGQPL